MPKPVLPTITTPKFDITLPSDGASVKFRPFLVKEQKLILSAIEMRDSNQLNNALDDILNECTFNALDIDSRPVYDIEYLILQIRAKSVSNIVEINYVCQNEIQDKLLNDEQMRFDPNAEPIHGPGTCETRIPVKIDLNGLNIDTSVERPKNVVMFTDDIGVELRDIPYGVYKKISGSTADNSLLSVAACINSVIDGENLHSRSDFTDEELMQWIESLAGEDFDKLQPWIQSMPSFKMTLPITCPHCGAKDTITLQGLDDFLV